MRKAAVIMVCTAMGMSLLSGCSVTIPETTEETSVAELGPARLQDDFYRYINEDQFDIDNIEYGSQGMNLAFNTKKVDEELESIIKDTVAGSGYEAGSEEEIIKKAYEYYLAYNFEEEPIPEDLMKMIEKIEGASSVDELLKIDAELVKDYGTDGFFKMGPASNPFDSTELVLSFYQIGSILSTSFDAMREDIDAIEELKMQGAVIMSTRGNDKDTSDQYGIELAYLAMDLYSGTNTEIFDELMPYQYMKIYTADQIKEVFSNVDIDAYLTAMGLDTSKISKFCVCDEKQIVALNGIFVEKNLNALKAWELGNLYSAYADYICPHYRQLNSMIGRSYKTKEEQALDAVQFSFSSLTDPIYVERYYSPETDKALRDMCDDIREGYKDIIFNATWLSEDTRAELLRKLENIVYVTGSDLERHDNSLYAGICGSNYYELCKNYNKVNYQKMLEALSTPVSRTEIAMPMQTMNACYDPSFNNITITVAITNAPFFDIKADYYTNLGGLGMVIAHEMGHAFDSNCIVFNAKGEYDPSWIPDADMETLLARNEKAVKYFEENFTVFGVYHVDGERTLGENYADLGGMECITSLTKTKEDRMKLFENYAKIWCSMYTDDAIIGTIANDVHSPDLVRVNAVLGTLDAFYETYDIKEGDGMYIAPEKRISRWY